MKRLTCEMCGSTDLIKNGGAFECQVCGCKYSVEEAKKMMLEITGTVDVTGSTVKIDNNAQIEKYLQNARRAYSKSDWSEVEKYYNLVERERPDNIEAIFYSAYAKAVPTLRNKDMENRKAAFHVLSNSISIIDDNFDIKDKVKNKELIYKINEDVEKICNMDFVYDYDHTVLLINIDKAETNALFIELKKEFKATVKNIIEKFREAKDPDGEYLFAFTDLTEDDKKAYLKDCASEEIILQWRKEYDKLTYEKEELDAKVKENILEVEKRMEKEYESLENEYRACGMFEMKKKNDIATKQTILRKDKSELRNKAENKSLLEQQKIINERVADLKFLLDI